MAWCLAWPCHAQCDAGAAASMRSCIASAGSQVFAGCALGLVTRASCQGLRKRDNSVSPSVARRAIHASPPNYITQDLRLVNRSGGRLHVPPVAQLIRRAACMCGYGWVEVAHPGRTTTSAPLG